MKLRGFDCKDLTVLFVDDEKNILDALRRNLYKETYKKLFSSGARDALSILETEPVHVVISDLMMPEMDGLSFLREVKARFPDMVRVVLSGAKDMIKVVEAINSGEVYRYISKPVEISQLKQVLSDAFDMYCSKREREELFKKLERQHNALRIAVSKKAKAEAELNKALKKEKELEARIEKHLLRGEVPKEIRRARIAAFSIPSRHMDGDFFEFMPFSESCFDLVVGDVMGKGVQAALIGVGTKLHFFKAVITMLGSIETCHLPSPETIVSSVHSILSERLMALESFVTLFYGRFDMKTDTLSFIDCGHPKTLQYQARKDSCIFLEGENMPMGMFENEVYISRSIGFEKGDVFLFYSDGITESVSPGGEMFGLERLSAYLKANCSLHPTELIHGLIDKVTKFTGSDSFGDDLTCSVIAIE